MMKQYIFEDFDDKKDTYLIYRVHLRKYDGVAQMAISTGSNLDHTSLL